MTPNPIIAMTFDALHSETNVLPLPMRLVKKIIKCNQVIHLSLRAVYYLSPTVIKWDAHTEIKEMSQLSMSLMLKSA